MKRLLRICPVFLLLLCLPLSSCSTRLEALTLSETTDFLHEHREDLEIVAAYLRRLDYDDVWIKNPKVMFAEFYNRTIESGQVSRSIRQLMKNGCQRIVKNSADNTVWFELWDALIIDENCGLACTIDGRGIPNAEYQTEATELVDGWFYYYADYNEWRVSRNGYKS